MPPITQQSSRAGLITALVVFVILFIVSTVFAFHFYGAYQTSDVNYTAYRSTYNKVLSDAAIQSGPVQALLSPENRRKLGINSNDTVVDVLFKQVNSLTGIIGAPTGQKISDVVDGVGSTIAENQKKLDAAGVKLTIPTTGLETAVSALTDAAVASQKTLATLTSDLGSAQAKAETSNKDLATVNSQRDADVQKAVQSGKETEAQLNKSLDDNKATIEQMTQAQKDAADKAASTINQTSAELAAAKAAGTKAQSSIDALQNRLANYRVDVTNSTIRQADGQIVRVPNDQTCYINLGQGDQVSNGLTFEVYDKATGVPPIPKDASGDEQLPVGKASIEITHVGVTSSECRIVKIQPGAIISEGDIIANLVYDPHVKYKFYVYGKFDLAGNGRPNANDAAFIKQLVTQWGGKLADKVDVNTDFLVLGSEPVIPNFSKDDLTPENQAKLDAANQDAAAYQDVEQKAKDLHIPILNQNRFLYYVGYYDQAKR